MAVVTFTFELYAVFLHPYLLITRSTIGDIPLGSSQDLGTLDLECLAALLLSQRFQPGVVIAGAMSPGLRRCSNRGNAMIVAVFKKTFKLDGLKILRFESEVTLFFEAEGRQEPSAIWLLFSLRWVAFLSFSTTVASRLQSSHCRYQA